MHLRSWSRPGSGGTRRNRPPMGVRSRRAAGESRRAVGHQILVAHFEDDARHRRLPMLHEAPIRAVVAADLSQVVGEWIAVLEQGLVDRVADGHGVARDVNDPRIRQRAANQAAIQIIERHFVGESAVTAEGRARTAQIVGPSAAKSTPAEAATSSRRGMPARRRCARVRHRRGPRRSSRVRPRV
jgi:hypothetical protein